MSKGIIFFSTPHQGSSVAALTQATEMLVWPSIEVKELRERKFYFYFIQKVLIIIFNYH